MDEFFKYDSRLAASKGLVYIGNDILFYQRDDKTDKYPFHFDLPGGGAESGETPFETFQREVKEEFGLDIQPNDISYARLYPSVLEVDKVMYFPVAKLPQEQALRIKFGDEGVEYFIRPLDAYLAQDNTAWPEILKRYIVDYLNAVNKF